MGNGEDFCLRSLLFNVLLFVLSPLAHLSNLLAAGPCVYHIQV